MSQDAILISVYGSVIAVAFFALFIVRGSLIGVAIAGPSAFALIGYLLGRHNVRIAVKGGA